MSNIVTFTAQDIQQFHDEELIELGGLPGFHQDKLEGIVARVDQAIYYTGMEDAFDISALYMVSIAKAHAFNDGNKRTALAVSLAYLKRNRIDIPANCGLNDLTVEVASWSEYQERLVEMVADELYRLAEENDQFLE